MPAFDFVLAGRYRLTAPLGEGGMAAVYRGRDLRLNREVAVKILREDLTRDPEFLTRFEREAQFVAAMSHPNIVPIYDVGEDKGSRFIVMEYIRGRTLREAIEREGSLPAERAIPIMHQVLQALAYAHERGLVHRDVKPHNILLGHDGTARLADFGIARVAGDSATRTAAILGSAHYLSPEQCRGEEATERSDLYACGIVLHEMLSGRPPFDGSNALAIANQHLHSAPPTVSGAGETLRDVISTALAKDPGDRFAGASQFEGHLPTVLDAAVTQPVVAVRPVPRPVLEGVPEQRLVLRRSPRKTAVAAGAGIIALAGLGYLASLHIAQYRLPQYPSGPYALVPALLALGLIVWWLQSRSWVYTLDGNAAVVQWGTLSHHRFGVPIHQIGMLQLKQSAIDRAVGVGTIELLARDQEGFERRLVMEDLSRPRQTYDELMKMIGQSARGRQPSSEER